jgi:hypothetical protein
MPRRSATRPTAAILLLLLLATACTAAAPAGSPVGSVASAVAEATPGAVDPTLAVSESGTGTGSVILPSPSSAGPPDAALAAEGGDGVTGQLGSFTWNGGGSDSPWLPGTPVDVGAGEPLIVTVADNVVVSDWSARRVPAGTANGSGAVSLGGGQAPITFRAPDPGSWSVQVLARFAGGIGSASYYWQVTVR